MKGKWRQVAWYGALGVGCSIGAIAALTPGMAWFINVLHAFMAVSGLILGCWWLFVTRVVKAWRLRLVVLGFAVIHLAFAWGSLIAAITSDAARGFDSALPWLLLGVLLAVLGSILSRRSTLTTTAEERAER